MSLVDSYVRGYLKERFVHFDEETTTDDDRAALLVANIDLPSFVNLLDRLAERCCRAWNVGNDGQRPERERDLANRNHAELQEAIERLASLFDIAVDWPGLYPSFTFNGHGYHTPLSVMRAVMEKRQASVELAKWDLLHACERVQGYFDRMGPVLGESDAAHEERMLRAMVRTAVNKARGHKQ